MLWGGVVSSGSLRNHYTDYETMMNSIILSSFISYSASLSFVVLVILPDFIPPF
jgi:hypothetical protein